MQSLRNNLRSKRGNEIKRFLDIDENTKTEDKRNAAIEKWGKEIDRNALQEKHDWGRNEEEGRNRHLDLSLHQMTFY